MKKSQIFIYHSYSSKVRFTTLLRLLFKEVSTRDKYKFIKYSHLCRYVWFSNSVILNAEFIFIDLRFDSLSGYSRFLKRHIFILCYFRIYLTTNVRWNIFAFVIGSVASTSTLTFKYYWDHGMRWTYYGKTIIWMIKVIFWIWRVAP